MGPLNHHWKFLGVLEVLLETIPVVVPYIDKRGKDKAWDRQIKHLSFVRNTVFWVQIVNVETAIANW